MKVMLVLAAAVLCGPCFAQSEAMDADLACLVSISMLPELNKQTHSMSDEAAEKTAMMGTMYFMGKISGRDPKFDIEAALLKNFQILNNATVGTTLVRCGGELQDQGAHWQTIGQHLMQRGKGEAPK